MLRTGPSTSTMDTPDPMLQKPIGNGWTGKNVNIVSTFNCMVSYLMAERYWCESLFRPDALLLQIELFHGVHLYVVDRQNHGRELLSRITCLSSTRFSATTYRIIQLRHNEEHSSNHHCQLIPAADPDGSINGALIHQLSWLNDQLLLEH